MLQHETVQLEKICSSEEIEINKLDKFISIIEEMINSSQSNTLSLDRVVFVLKQLQVRQTLAIVLLSLSFYRLDFL